MDRYSGYKAMDQTAVVVKTNANGIATSPVFKPNAVTGVPYKLHAQLGALHVDFLATNSLSRMTRL